MHPLNSSDVDIDALEKVNNSFESRHVAVGRGDKLQTAYHTYNNRHQSEKKPTSSSFLVMKGNNVFKERNAYSGFY